MNLDEQRRKRPGNRARIDRIKAEMDQEVESTAGDIAGDVNHD